MKENFIRVLGSADWHQTAYNDHSCYTVGDQILVDACPSVVTTLLEQGVDPVDIRLVLMTHMHSDHYMGLTPLLQYWRVCKDKDLSALTIAGPKDTLCKFLQMAMVFAFEDELAANVEKMPNIIEIEEGSQIDFPPYKIQVGKGDHAVPDVIYRITDCKSGHAVGFTGDTRYLDSFPDFFRDIDLLVHEASAGAGPINPTGNAGSRHSSAQEAVKVCREGGVKNLLLTHSYEPNRKAALDAARSQLTIPVDWAMPRHIYPY